MKIGSMLRCSRRFKEYVARKEEEIGYAFKFSPNLVTDLTGEYALIIVTVNRCQFLKSLPILKTNKKNANILFMLNHWDITNEIEKYFTKEEYLLGIDKFFLFRCLNP